MAAAACGSPGAGELSQRRKKGSDSRRRQAALYFLNNISLDGRPLCPPPPLPLLQSWENPEPSPRIPPSNGPRILLSRDTGLPDTPAATTSTRIVPSLSLPPAGASVQSSRSKLVPESPRNLKKTHFIKNMRQYDTRSSRIVLICAKRSLCAAFSVLPYGESLRISELQVEGTKQRHPSGGTTSSMDPAFGMEGVELGAEGEVVSYAKFLYPTNALVFHKEESQGKLGFQEASKRNVSNTRFKPVSSGCDLGPEAEGSEYNPDILDDPQWPCGKHKRVLIFASYMTTVIEYVKPSDLKKDMNEMFKEKFPNVKLTLSKIRSLKREMRNVGEESGIEPVTMAMSYVYFEKLVLQGKVNKQNRKLCAGACVLLAAKISSDFKKPELKHLLDKLEERFRSNRRDLVAFELTVLVAMELALYLPEAQVLPHFRRLTKQQ